MPRTVKRENADVANFRNLLLRCDWVTRHSIWEVYLTWATRKSDRLRVVGALQRTMSSCELIDGECDGIVLDRGTIIPLPPPPPKLKQLKLTRFFKKVPKMTKATGKQMKITHYFNIDNRP